MQFAILVALSLIANCLAVHGKSVPIKKRSTSGSGDPSVFQMTQESKDNYQWQKNSTLENLSTSSIAGMSHFGNPPRCDPNGVPLEGAEYPVNLRSSCPWYYDTNYDATRFPNTVLTAIGICDTGCIGHPGMQCEKIETSMSVLKQDQTSGEYVQSEMKVVVGYTCAGKRTVPNGTPAPTTSAPGGDYPDYA